MKLLVFAHTPPPLHGQSAMVARLVEGLRGDPAIEVLHVNPRLSRDTADIGRWRWGKLTALLRACRAARRLQREHGRCVLYYVPAPGKRSALHRDFLVMLLCRRRGHPLVLHWHASGMGEWLESRATWIERRLAQRLLGGAELALVLAPELRDDAARLAPQRIALVPNGVAVPEPAAALRAAGACCEVLFLGLCSRDKGVFDTIEAVARADERTAGGFRLTVAGGFASAEDEHAFHARVAQLRAGLVRHVGFADEAKKHALLAAADVFCFPTAYPHEGQPLVLMEALAHDVPIVTTRWRAIPGMLPVEHVWYVAPHQPAEIAEALIAACHAPKPAGALRRHYLAHFTPEHHLAALRAALLSVSPATRT